MTTFAEDPRETADGMLARAHLAGDPEAFASLFRRYYPNLVSYHRAQVRDHALAEDLAQETVARALRYLPSYDPARPLWPWLRKIAQHVAGAEASRRAHEICVWEVETHAEPAEIDLCESYVARDVLAQALSRLPVRQQRALILRYVEDRAPEEIATTLGVTRGTLDQLLFRARNSLGREYAAIESATPAWRGWVPALPFAGRLREFAASWHSRVVASAEAAMAVGGNVAIGLAIVAGGTTAGAVTSVAGGTPAAVPARAEVTSVATVASPSDRTPARASSGTRPGTATAPGTRPGRPATVAVPPAPPRDEPGPGDIDIDKPDVDIESEGDPRGNSEQKVLIRDALGDTSAIHRREGADEGWTCSVTGQLCRP